MQVNLTQKERMLLEDQKSHEEICIQKYSNYANQVQDPQLKQICKNNEQIERSHLNTINQLLSGNVPQMNQQQGGQKNQGVDQNVNKSQTSTSNLSDKEICSDLLMTEKYVSGAYDTAIFEFKDTEVRDVLNHIQKEEQKHGESIFKYMESKGMYNVQ
ncbi:spore coat protein CotF [Clostridium beijerinckii]|uniref:spore coat protein n=1 Tax=Clostridium beijerinckii TaxID=1520 RepID=UPI00149457A4|nr:spore coat protein [Clostridium beijerinckii]NOW90922.1 spore coat protein CotF [Clostridium beijerinckii]